jgi:hypothetical protein
MVSATDRSAVKVQSKLRQHRGEQLAQECFCDVDCKFRVRVRSLFSLMKDSVAFDAHTSKLLPKCLRGPRAFVGSGIDMSVRCQQV